LTRVFANARLRNVKTKKQLIDFHSAYKLILMCYDQEKRIKLGHLVAYQDDFNETFSKYKEIFQSALSSVPRCQANTNVLLHAFGHFSRKLNKKEQQLFFRILDNYRKGKEHLSSLVSLVKSWAIRFDDEYLQSQAYFQPYPDEIIDLKDTGKKMDTCTK
jgi:uncharacterized protein YbgA (DUF1722 family)